MKDSAYGKNSFFLALMAGFEEVRLFDYFMIVPTYFFSSSKMDFIPKNALSTFC